jgi:hypothetical protein
LNVNITISGNLEVDEDDLARLKSEGAQELMRALELNGAKIATRVTEVYQKTKKA